MASINWDGKTGNWATAADWIGGVVPGASDDATIGGSGTYTVTVSSSDAARSLSVDDQGATVAVNGGGTLTIGSSLALTTGTLQLDEGGVISGGTLSATGGAFQWDGGSVEGVTYEGIVNLSTNGALLIVGTGGLKTEGAGGTGSGTVNLSGQGSEIDYLGNQLLVSVTVDIGTAANGKYLASVLYADPGSNNGKMTLAGSARIDQTNSYAVIGGGDKVDLDEGGSGSITNNGAINATYFSAGSGGVLRINPANFINDGDITIGNASTLCFQATGTFTNSGTGVITAEAGSTLIIGDPLRNQNGDDGVYSNDGKITATDATIDLYGTLTGTGTLEIANSSIYITTNLSTNQLEGWGGNGNEIIETGTVNNAGSVLYVGTGTELGQLALDGTIIGGTVNDAGNGLRVYAPDGGYITFDGVTYDGTVNFDGEASQLNVTNGGLTLNGAGGTGSGTMNVSGSSQVFFYDSQTIDNATINFNITNYTIDLFQENTGNTKYALTLGAGLTLNEIGDVGYLDIDGGTVINDGTIDAESGSRLTGDLLSIGANFFTNNGKLIASNGDTLTLNVPNDGTIIGHQTGGSDFTNFAGGILTGGSYEVDADSIMELPNNGTLVADAATIILNGAGSTMQTYNTTTHVYTTIESSLTTIRSPGALEILGARGYTTANAISNSGTLQLGGGVFSSGKLTDASGSILIGFGTIASAFADSGVVTASGGTLAFTGKGNTFAGALGGTTIDFAGGSDLLKAGTSVTAEAIGLGGGVTVTLGESLRYSGALSQAVGTTLALGTDTLNLTGAGTALAGAITGTGTLYFGGGSQTVNSGASLLVSKWTIAHDASASVTTNVGFAGTFEAEAGTALAISSGDTLSLTSSAVFSGGAIVDGGGVLSLSHGTLRGMAIGGTMTVVDTQLVAQTGAVTLGDSGGDAATLLVDSGATYRIVGNVGIARGASASSVLVNDGVLDRASGTGVSAIGVAVTDTGTIVAAAGTLEFTQAITGAGGIRIYASGTLEADATVGSSLTVGFNSPGGILALGDASGFSARISKFASGDTIDLIETAATSASLEKGDKLQIMNGTQSVATLQLVGSYAHDTFSVASDGHGGSTIKVTTTDLPMTQNPAHFTQAMASLPVEGGLWHAAPAMIAHGPMIGATLAAER